MKRLLSFFVLLLSLTANAQVEIGIGEYANYMVDMGNVYTHDANVKVQYPLPEKARAGTVAAGHPFGYIIGESGALYMLTGDSRSFKKIADRVRAVAAYWEYAVVAFENGSGAVYKSGVQYAFLRNFPENVVQIAAGYIIVTRSENGAVSSYPWNTGNRVWLSGPALVNLLPKQVPLPGPASWVTTSRSMFSCAIVAGKPYAWCGTFGAKYIGLKSAQSTPKLMPWPGDFVKCEATDITLHLLDVDGYIYGMGDGAVGTVGDGTMSPKVLANGNWDMAWSAIVPFKKISDRQYDDIFAETSYGYRIAAREIKTGIISTCGYGKGGLLMNGVRVIGDNGQDDPYTVSIVSVPRLRRTGIPDRYTIVRSTAFRTMVANGAYPPAEYVKPRNLVKRVCTLHYDDGTTEIENQ